MLRDILEMLRNKSFDVRARFGGAEQNIVLLKLKSAF